MNYTLSQDISSNRHGGNEQSQQANKKIQNRKEQQRDEVLEVISRFGDAGRTMKEVASMMGKPFNAVSGRGSELKKLGKVEKTGEVRDGSAVLRATSLRVEFVSLPASKLPTKAELYEANYSRAMEMVIESYRHA